MVMRVLGVMRIGLWYVAAAFVMIVKHEVMIKNAVLLLQICRNLTYNCNYMSSPSERFNEALRTAGYSLSNPRLSVFNVLLASGPLSIADLQRAIPDINRSSIYRTLELFEKLNIVHRLNIGWKHKYELSDRFSHHHHHAICTDCGSIIDLPEDSDIESRLKVLATSHGFVAHDHQLEIRGVCANCQPT